MGIQTHKSINARGIPGTQRQSLAAVCGCLVAVSILIEIGAAAAQPPPAGLNPTTPEGGRATPGHATPATLDDESPVQAVGQVAESCFAAFHRGDAKAVAAHWTEDGDFINIEGKRTQGREAIEREFQRFFAEHPGCRLTRAVGSIRMIGPDVAIEDGTAAMAPAPPGSPPNARYTIIYARRDGRWLIESMRDAATPATSSYEHLKQLEWMVGQWADDSEKDRHAVQSTCAWTMNKSFLIRTFASLVDGETILRGTEVIGWDPRTGKIRSWVFDSDGGFSQNTWTRRGDRWLIRESGVLQDGREVTALDVLTRRGDNTVTLRSPRRTADGRPLPDIDEIEIRRKP
jgi:uncharacterized protein (TIGR02246 family)